MWNFPLPTKKGKIKLIFFLSQNIWLPVIPPWNSANIKSVCGKPFFNLAFMFNALFGSAAPLHCAKFLKRFDDNRMKVSLPKQRWTWLERGGKQRHEESKCQHKMLHQFRINSSDGSTVRQRCCNNNTIKWKSLPATQWIILIDDQQYKQWALIIPEWK